MNANCSRPLCFHRKNYNYGSAISFHEIYFFFTVSSLRITTRTQLPLVKSRERGTDLIDELFGQQEDKAVNLAGAVAIILLFVKTKLLELEKSVTLGDPPHRRGFDKPKTSTALDLLKKFDLRMLMNQKREKNKKINGRLVSTVSVEISGFFCHSDFT